MLKNLQKSSFYEVMLKERQNEKKVNVGLFVVFLLFAASAYSAFGGFGGGKGGRAPVVPEPMSCLLFLASGAAYAGIKVSEGKKEFKAIE